ncbi:MAG: hypothetical protein QXP98_05890 [Thermoproteus sp.]
MPLPSFFFDPVVVASLPIVSYLAMNMSLPFLLRGQRRGVPPVELSIALGSAAMFALVVLAVLRAVGAEVLMVPAYWNFAAGLVLQYRYTKSNPVVALYFAVMNIWFLDLSLSKITALVVGR